MKSLDNMVAALAAGDLFMAEWWARFNVFLLDPTQPCPLPVYRYAR